jgi:hypothetical protein
MASTVVLLIGLAHDGPSPSGFLWPDHSNACYLAGLG